jgi:DNA-binding beta-propeller fold protein YncE
MRRLDACILALLLLLLAGCSNRTRDNPFDPGNPTTGGKPPGFRAVAEDSKATLRWELVVSDNLAGYELFRRGPGDPDFLAVGGVLAADQTSFVDLALTNDSTYAYRLRFVLTDGRRGPFGDALARPGVGIVWVADAAPGLVVRVAPDGRARVLDLEGLETPGFVSADPALNRVWSSSREQGVVAVWAADGHLVDVEGTFGAPGDVSPIPGTSAAWVSDERTGSLVRFDAGVGLTATAGPFQLPSDVIAEPGGSAWVADRDAKRLVHVTGAGVVNFEQPLPDRPWRIALDPVTANLWISYTEAGAVECRTMAGSLVFRLNGLESPFTLAPDVAGGRMWVVLASGDAVVAFDRTGAPAGRINGIPRPRGAATDPRNGEVWITALGSGDGDGSLWHFSAAGGLISTLAPFGRPFAVDFDPTP